MAPSFPPQCAVLSNDTLSALVLHVNHLSPHAELWIWGSFHNEFSAVGRWHPAVQHTGGAPRPRPPHRPGLPAAVRPRRHASPSPCAPVAVRPLPHCPREVSARCSLGRVTREHCHLRTSCILHGGQTGVTLVSCFFGPPVSVLLSPKRVTCSFNKLLKRRAPRAGRTLWALAGGEPRRLCGAAAFVAHTGPGAFRAASGAVTL